MTEAPSGKITSSRFRIIHAKIQYWIGFFHERFLRHHARISDSVLIGIVGHHSADMFPLIVSSMGGRLLAEFLVRAKINAYAALGEVGVAELDDGSKELNYEEAVFRYRDRYFGFNPFVGEEVVWERGHAVWAMNYYGRITSGKITEERVYEFLRKALRQVEKNVPFRGPHNFKEGTFGYVNETEGDINCFSGVETIQFSGQEVYRLRYHGGHLKIVPT